MELAPGVLPLLLSSGEGFWTYPNLVNNFRKRRICDGPKYFTLFDDLFSCDVLRIRTRLVVCTSHRIQQEQRDRNQSKVGCTAEL